MYSYSLRRPLALLSLFLIPVVCLSMGGCPPPATPAECGNGTVEGSEECDDGNTTAGDGCSASCRDEDAAVCGNGTEEEGEECDDGNTEDGDGCSSDCQEEAQPADSDGDGVPDETDECPGTARGAEVNDVGCPEGGNDPDNDGVSGTDDLCPNTPTGAPVDEDGCAPNQRDTDGDGFTDSIDACPNIPAGDMDEDEDGCPDSAGGPDDDEDGVPNDIDLCEDTPAGQEANAEGCSASQRDTDDDGVNDDQDDCPNQAGNAQNNGCPDGGGGGPVCGNGAVEAGEQCDDDNIQSGDGCSATCRIETSNIPNDNCANAQAIGDGSLVYSNVGATTDGPEEPADCTFFERGDIRADLWYCYTATCTGEADFSLCGSGYDTKMAVYEGCECPDPGPADRPLGCSDDNCGTGADNTQSRVSINVTSGQTYLVRVGGFFGNREQGEGRLTIRCGVDTCVGATGSCTTAHDDNQPGCDDADCCNEVCEVDTFCCDVTWDSFCASEASGFCAEGGFASCSSRAGSCTTVNTEPGCSDDTCCEAVCTTDPFCCITAWDQPCVDAGTFCDNCGGRRGSCSAVQTGGGCEDVPCCIRVCAADEFCCTTTWDQTCVDRAEDLCP